ncbi:MAG: sigma-70 family RNA polymerase sigma factor [Phycisphaerales bacterium]|nr:sigma-70 family RNA polymerase sigma factor [Phycisphaerales bacterium]
MSERWDQTLPIEAAIEGHADALSQVWVGVRRWVAVILMAHKPREADLEDLMQLVALQVCRKVHEVRDPSLFKPWLRTVTINIAREQGRKASRKRVGMLRLVGRTRHEANQMGNMQLSEDAKRVLDAALSLPEKYREPVLMRCQQSMSYKQIAEVLSLPETTVETRIARGRRMLRETLDIQTKQELEAKQRNNQARTISVGGAG